MKITHKVVVLARVLEFTTFVLQIMVLKLHKLGKIWVVFLYRKYRKGWTRSYRDNGTQTDMYTVMNWKYYEVYLLEH